MIVIYNMQSIQLAFRLKNRLKRIAEKKTFDSDEPLTHIPVLTFHEHSESRTWAHQRPNHWLQEEL